MQEGVGLYFSKGAFDEREAPATVFHDGCSLDHADPVK